MKQYDTFIFDSYSWDPKEGTVTLNYSLDDDLTFTETLTFPASPFLDASRQDDFDRALFALHLIGGISYYKTCLPKKIEVRSGTLTEEQATFWNSVYENGLGEFFYKNNTDFEGLIRFPGTKAELREAQTPGFHAPGNQVLIPVGGGKDSVVTIELLREKGAAMTLLRLGHHLLIEKLASTAALPLLTINRALSPELFKLNADGALNGHIPITAYLSCVTIAAAILYGFDAVAMSNEKSANEGNVEFRGKMINHQWSKSEEFERMFQKYVSDFITPRISYSSILRPMTELQIVQRFARYPQYFHCTTSCNTNWRILGKKDGGAAMNRSAATGAWCCRCPKCAFVFALYAAFLPKETVLEIFGKDLFADPSLHPLYRELLGLEGFKPFECVGTPEETKEAFDLAKANGFTPPAL